MVDSTHLKNLFNMATIAFSDIIFATITLRGKVMACLKLNGVKSYAEVLARLLAAVSGGRGMATVHVRNSTQGWAASRSVMLA